MATFESVIEKLNAAFRECENSKMEFMNAYPDMERILQQIDAGGTLAEDTHDLIVEAMGEANPKDLDEAKLLIAAACVSAASARITVEGALKNIQSSIAEMNEASSRINTYIGKIS